MKTILVTGSSGFIGYHLVKSLLNDNNYKIIGIDNMNNYYDLSLKNDRLNNLLKYNNYNFIKCDINNKEDLNKIFEDSKIDIVINLAAKAGVRYSITNPDTYIESNILGFYNILELSKKYNIEHLIYASSSSVYGDNINVPYNEEENTDKPVSLYAATKKCNEILAYSYSKLYNLNVTGLRFFTVYGPLGRPDMAYYSFTNKLINNEIINVFNNGNLKRDFTYIDDVVDAIKIIINNKPINNYNIYNIGNENPILIKDFINILYKELIKQKLLLDNFDISSHIEYLDMQKGDVYETHSDTSKLYKDFNFKPKVSIDEGIEKFIKWYKDYYGDKK